MSGSDAKRLEALWSGEFGDRYVDRNVRADEGRSRFWSEQMEKLRPENVLEVGCNVGGNLVWVAEAIGAQYVAGVDVNEKALAILRDRIPGADVRHASATHLPFADGDAGQLHREGGIAERRQPRRGRHNLFDHRRTETVFIQSQRCAEGGKSPGDSRDNEPAVRLVRWWPLQRREAGWSV